MVERGCFPYVLRHYAMVEPLSLESRVFTAKLLGL